MNPRALLVTIGQTPRSDLVPEIQTWFGDRIGVEERGALDGLARHEIAAMTPRDGDHRLVTRLADGTEVVVRKDLVHARLQAIFDRLATGDFLCTVLLCTGHFPPFRVSGLFLDAQSIVDDSVAAIARHARSIGVMVPLEEQIDEFHFRPGDGQTLKTSYASPYTPRRLEQAAADLAGTDVIVMHCMGYTEAMRRTVADVSRRPVLLARRLVAAAVGQLVP
ncbi:MAG TPA: AroM family protein [Vicinamibacterales bacterium]|nr:AroM family protein [Vicinamibacterales bacterium]